MTGSLGHHIIIPTNMTYQVQSYHDVLPCCCHHPPVVCAVSVLNLTEDPDRCDTGANCGSSVLHAVVSAVLQWLAYGCIGNSMPCTRT
jgi:uncharacterized membrane protein